MGLGPLRVINEDRVIPQGGFPNHPHQNMEILTYVLEGEIVHEDSMGNRAQVRPGEIQLMSAGTGVTHSEFNGSAEAELHLLQIWILPNVTQTKPGYQQMTIPMDRVTNQLGLLVSPDVKEGTLVIKQDAKVKLGKFSQGFSFHQVLDPQRNYWLQVTRGQLQVNGERLEAGDGVALREESKLELKVDQASEVLSFDLP